MARPREWLARIPKALAHLEEFPAPWLDRATVARLFDVSPRTAHRILQRFGAEVVGGGLVISREALRLGLQSVLEGAEYGYIAGRRRRLEDRLRDVSLALKSRRVLLRRQSHGPAVPTTVRIGGGRLEVDFTGTLDLLGQLYALVQVAAEDFEQFEQLVERSSG